MEPVEGPPHGLPVGRDDGEAVENLAELRVARPRHEAVGAHEVDRPGDAFLRGADDVADELVVVRRRRLHAEQVMLRGPLKRCGLGAHGYLAPFRKRTDGTVRNRIDRSLHSERCFMYATSMRTHSSNVTSIRP